MNTKALIDEITDIVISRISEKKIESTVPFEHVKKTLSVVLTALSDNTDSLISELRKLSHVCDFLFFVSKDCCAKRAELISNSLKGRIFFDLPPNWKSMVCNFSAVYVPVFDMSLCSKTAMLIPDCLASKLLVQSLIEQKTIFAGSEELTLLKSVSARLPKALLSVFSANLNSVMSMGIREVSLSQISKVLEAFFKDSDISVSVRPNNVITKEDIDQALKEGAKVIELRSGTIVTPLAKDYAQSLNLNIIFR